MTFVRHSDQAFEGFEDFRLDAISGIDVVLGDELPDVGQVLKSLGREPI